MKKALIPSFLFTALAGSFWVAEASAHARWSQDGTTPGRNNQANLKAGPCGNVPRGANAAVFKAGQTITLNWESTIYHEGYFRISFSKAGDANFEQTVLLDNIPERERPPGPYSAQVTLPREPCNDCTLQLIQVMPDRNPPTNYYSCADIQLQAETPADTQPPAAVTVFEWANNNSRLQWQNPANDFAGVLLLSGDEAGATEPKPGVFYNEGDLLGTARVVYVGQAQGFDVSGVGRFSIYAFDEAANYSAAVHNQGVTPEPDHYFDFSVEYEQVGHMAEQVFAADGDVAVEASLQWLNSPQGASAGEVSLTLSEPHNAVVITEQAANSWLFDPVDFAGQRLELDVTGVDADRPAKPLIHSLLIDIMPYSYYKPKLVVYQGGKAITNGMTDAGEITVQVEFEAAAPNNLTEWRAQWSHTGVEGAVVSANGMALRFPPPNKSASLAFDVEVFSASAPAAPVLNTTLDVNKPITLGALSASWLLLLTVLGLIDRARLQARP